MIIIEYHSPGYFYHNLNKATGYEERLTETLSVIFVRKGVYITPIMHLPEALTKYIKCKVKVLVDPKVKQECLESNARRKELNELKSAKVDSNFGLKLDLYDYQKTGVNYLVNAKRALLLDKVGIGKTPVIIGLVNHLLSNGLISDGLIICKAHLKIQMYDEFLRFSNVVPRLIDQSVKHKIKGLSYKQRREDWLSNEKNTIFIVNYELLRINPDLFLNKKWGVIVADEITYVKGSNKTTRIFNKLKCDYFVGASATLVENQVQDIYNAFHIVDPNILGNMSSFEQTHLIYETQPFKRIVEIKKVKLLKKKIEPYILRRGIEQLDEVPDEPTYENLIVELSPKQKSIYKNILDDTKRASLQVEHNSKFIGSLVKLRRVCDHTALVRQEFNESSKLDLLLELLLDIKSQCIIFTEWVGMAIIINDAIDANDKLGSSDVIYGSRQWDEGGITKTKSMSSGAKAKKIKAFQNGEFKFLVASDCIKDGVNLTNAQILINFNLPWNPAKALQRVGRLRWHRQLGKQCKIFNILTINTVEDRIREVLNNKANLSRNIIEALKTLPQDKELIKLFKN